ncbi:MAG: prepilin peptidase [Alphaproteobacteria bacterium]|nr:prepilin peptidase [Alphaproteobacteria bacterium]
MFTNRILTSLIYFSTGFFIPVLSRFLMKFYPCSMHSYFGDMLKYYFNKNKYKVKDYNKRYNHLKKQYFYNKLLWGVSYLITFTLLEYLTPIYINKSYPLILLYIILFLLGFSANIDAKCKIIPDIITFPMLMISILIAVYNTDNKIFSSLYITSFDSIFSAIASYLLCFTLALMFYFKNPYSFGGGDVKLISAISAFTGLVNLSWILIFSFAFAMVFFALKKEKYLALALLVFPSFILWLLLKILYYI